MLLNLSIFMWFGAVCPWATFLHNDVVPIYRLISLGVLILLFRRVPIVYAMHWKITQIEEKQQALFVGFFGPIGVSAVFYLYISLEFLGQVTVEGVVRKDASGLADIMRVVIWFLAMCSIVRTFVSKITLKHHAKLIYSGGAWPEHSNWQIGLSSFGTSVCITCSRRRIADLA